MFFPSSDARWCLICVWSPIFFCQMLAFFVVYSEFSYENNIVRGKGLTPNSFYNFLFFNFLNIFFRILPL